MRDILGQLSLLAAGEDEWAADPGADGDGRPGTWSARASASPARSTVFHRLPDGRVALMMLATTSLRRLDPVDQG